MHRSGAAALPIRVSLSGASPTSPSLLFSTGNSPKVLRDRYYLSRLLRPPAYIGRFRHHRGSLIFSRLASKGYRETGTLMILGRPQTLFLHAERGSLFTLSQGCLRRAEDLQIFGDWVLFRHPTMGRRRTLSRTPLFVLFSGPSWNPCPFGSFGSDCALSISLCGRGRIAHGNNLTTTSRPISHRMRSITQGVASP